MQISAAQNKAAGAIVELVAARVGANRAVHPETAIACAARLAGSLLLRSFNLKIEGVEPGTVVLSDEANEKVPQLIGIMTAVLQHLGVALDQEKLQEESTSRRGEEPTLTLVESLAMLQEDAMGIAAENGLGMEETAQAAAISTAFIVKECAKDIGAEVGFNVAAYGFIEGGKTAPPAMGPVRKPAAKKNPWYKVW